MTCGRKFLLLSVAFCFSLSAISWAEVCYTDAEYQELTEIFDKLERINNERLTQIKTLQTDLSESKDAQTVLNGELVGVERSLLEAKSSLAEERKAAGIRTILAAVCALIVGVAAGLLF